MINLFTIRVNKQFTKKKGKNAKTLFLINSDEEMKEKQQQQKNS